MSVIIEAPIVHSAKLTWNLKGDPLKRMAAVKGPLASSELL